MAHPYAPMGGSYDDRVVGIVIDEFLSAGFMVGTFNFRGAHGSKGRTSWSGRPELDDYTSFAAFFMHYMSYLQPSLPHHLVFAPEQPLMSPSSIEPVQMQNDVCPLVVLGGYSYGSLILRNLPPVPTILQPFSAPLAGSAADEIVLRARKLADQSNMEWVTLARDETRARKKNRAKHSSQPSITMGGEETNPSKRRSSREVRRSLEGSTRLEIRTRLRSLSHKRRDHNEPTTPTKVEDEAATPTKVENTDFTIPDTRYLIISPLTPPLSSLAAPALIHKFWGRSKDDHQEVVGKHTCLAIYGDQDIFTSAKKLRDWAEQLKANPASRFRSVEVAGAGHFWVERGVEEQLRVALKEWITET
jgi:alpha/beta superfamily hydrolase